MQTKRMTEGGEQPAYHLLCLTDPPYVFVYLPRSDHERPGVLFAAQVKNWTENDNGVWWEPAEAFWLKIMEHDFTDDQWKQIEANPEAALLRYILL